MSGRRIYDALVSDSFRYRQCHGFPACLDVQIQDFLTGPGLRSSALAVARVLNICGGGGSTSSAHNRRSNAAASWSVRALAHVWGRTRANDPALLKILSP